MPMHSHNFHEVIVVHAGCMYVTDEQGREVRATAGDCLLYPERVGHQEKSDPVRPVETSFISFHGVLKGGIQHLAQAEERVGHLARFVVEDFTKRQDNVLETTALQYLNLIAHELRKGRGALPNEQLVARVRQWMQAHVPDKISLEDLAKQARMSKFHFARLYRETTGYSPMVDLKRMRLNLAKSMLQSTRLPLKAVADQTGFANEYHLSREIKREYGRSPTSFRSHL